MNKSGPSELLMDLMRDFFRLRNEAAQLKELLEDKRRELHLDIGSFYDPKKNPDFAEDIYRYVKLRQQQSEVLKVAESVVSNHTAIAS
ncbi:hypothetical protein NAC44_12570 [Allorhizobium sp. BGMRC 0089]|uniref:hypothetical protein n=1 Tax=Allorhizobium sonneratiae TaxID=2934936 RepID=UPI002033729D|nr:hypothetical protein [Allorhizobium sonneratiae]MCM2293158.1 hypothetical protein [Allorhizobium sonneratiae]